MAESLATSADATTKDKRPNSGSSEGKSLGKFFLSLTKN
jgi:hypothetical protein